MEENIIPYFQTCSLTFDEQYKYSKKWSVVFTLEDEEFPYKFDAHLYAHSSEKQWYTTLIRKYNGERWVLAFDRSLYASFKEHTGEQVLRLLKKYSKEKIRLLFVPCNEEFKDTKYPELKKLTINE